MRNVEQFTTLNTLYDGRRFRSRTEAKWAVFFKTVGLRYQYEPQGFRLSNGETYLPDFWLPDLQMWFEVKGTSANVPGILDIARSPLAGR